MEVENEHVEVENSRCAHTPHLVQQGIHFILVVC